MLLLITFLVFNHAFAFERHKPYLTINQDPLLCAPFLQAWTEVFRNSGPVSEAALDLNYYFDDFKVFEFPPGDQTQLYGEGYFFEADINADHVPETFYLESEDIGWRYLGVNLFIVDDVKHLQQAAGLESLTIDHKIGLQIREDLKAYFHPVYEYAPASKVHILSGEKGLYTLSIPRQPHWENESSVSLFKLSKEKSEAVCQINLLPQKNKYEEFTRNHPLLNAFKDVYGGPEGCMGSMGWTADPVDFSLSDIFERPQVLESAPKDWHDSEAATQLRYISWAVSDPHSWSAYQAIERLKPSFISYLKLYYVQNFHYSEKRAEKTAHAALKYWLDHVMYSRNPDGYEITLAAQYLHPDISGDAKEIVNYAYQVFQEKPDELRDIEIVSSLLLALIYTRADEDHIISTLEKLKTFDAYQEVFDAALLASIGNQKLMQLVVDYGADVNAETNWFKKTPLMYAVQLNDIESVKFLVAHGAKINARTDGSGDACMKLERDHRTVFMYAAENASSELIRFLVDSDADIKAKDTQGNTAQWYFERNAFIQDSKERNEIAAKLNVAVR